MNIIQTQDYGGGLNVDEHGTDPVLQSHSTWDDSTSKGQSRDKSICSIMSRFFYFFVIKEILKALK